MRVVRDHQILADQCVVAEAYLDRLRGLIGKRALASGEGMLFPRCNDIHMWFMSIPIDVVFLRRDDLAPSGLDSFKVSSVRENLKPWRLLPAHDSQATETLELPAGTVRRFGIAAGDSLCIG